MGRFRTGTSSVCETLLRPVSLHPAAGPLFSGTPPVRSDTARRTSAAISSLAAPGGLRRTAAVEFEAGIRDIVVVRSKYCSRSSAPDRSSSSNPASASPRGICDERVFPAERDDRIPGGCCAAASFASNLDIILSASADSFGTTGRPRLSPAGLTSLPDEAGRNPAG